eukprot:TRINITY_DN6205_c0_g1_i1.p1 TRINITY_DN6205_c0_g1~~TRINITY_DN6205_c0_g1_i1.p1  ORF type:complete len:1093 (-),score=275.65 TRINITY_DN6205_c0_g1_i1:45-3323(-)
MDADEEIDMAIEQEMDASIANASPSAPARKRSAAYDEDPSNSMKRPATKSKSLTNTLSGASFDERLAADAAAIQAAKRTRPVAPRPFPTNEKLIFQQMEVDQYTRKDAVPGMPGAQRGPVPVLRMYGVTDEGFSVLAHVHGFMPYFYCIAPQGFTPDKCADFRRLLNQKLVQTNDQMRRLPNPELILGVELEKKQSIWGYSGNRLTSFLKITVAMPKVVPACRTMLEAGIGELDPLKTYESDLPFILRFMIDTGVVGGNWIELPANKYRLTREPTSTCQIEVDVAFDVFVSYEPEGEWSKVAPLRILSFDIECAGRKGVFPEPEHDPVINIANYITVQGDSQPCVRSVFCLRDCENIVGAEVRCFEDERTLLAEWRDFVVQMDPDIITGYNIQNFDLPYLINRAATLKVQKFPFLGRIRSEASVIKNSTFSSKAYGTHENKLINIDGRVQFDMMMMVQRDYKLSSYSLNSVSAHFLGEQKEDVQHSIITELFNGSPDTRRRLAVYCLKDAYLPQRLMDKLLGLYNYLEMSRVTGVPLSFLLQRGQQIKVISQLYRKSRQHNMVIPFVKTQGSDEKYEGAIVIEPKKGYYDVPITTLDFSSLYPSIMMAHNLCYSTLLAPAEAAGMTEGVDFVRTPTNDLFVMSSRKKGILAEILEELIAARKRAKNDLNKATDPFVKAVLDGRQLALKISANSVYGFTGATVGKLPCLAISSSVTAFGRLMIEKTKEVVEATYCIAKGFAHDAVVIYGDTDSVMVKFGVKTVEEAMELGRQAAELVTKEFVRPINLLFEKVYFPYLLMNKKRYAGMYWTKPDHYDRMDAKGIEIVRRDNCMLVRKVIGTCLQKILMDRDVQGAQEYAKAVISDLLNNRIDVSMLVISKSLSKTEYDNKQAHVELAERMRKRDAGSAPAVGDRVPYVMIQKGKGAKGYEKAEDPIYVLEHNLPLDTQYYLEQQLQQPLFRLFEPLMEHPNSLFTGAHTRAVTVVKSTHGAMSKFTVRTQTCLQCKTALKSHETTVCASCKVHEPSVYHKTVAKVAHFEAVYAKAWTQCQRCQGSLHQDILCTSRDCPIFYMRKKVQKDLKDAQETLDRFNLSW